jgi:hypothetical protein
MRAGEVVDHLKAKIRSNNKHRDKGGKNKNKKETKSGETEEGRQKQ